MATRPLHPALGLSGVLLLTPGVAGAHGYAPLYVPPVPVALYGWGAALTLVASFLVTALFLSRAPVEPGQSGQTYDLAALAKRLRPLFPPLRVLMVGVLGLTLATAYWGSRDPLRNFGMTAFWIHFVLLLPYLSLVLGHLYAALNPWRTLSDGLARLWRGYGQGRFAYPEWLGDGPALVLYLGFIHLELFGTGRPLDLAQALTLYTLLNLVGVGLVGRRAWFTHCEFFSVFLRLIALIAPLDYQRSDDGRPGRLRLRWPLSGLRQERPTRLSTVLFVLAMLSTTAFDGLRATQWWVNLFWADPTGLLQQWLGRHPLEAATHLLPVYRLWESAWLLLSPFLYLAAYLGALAMVRSLARSTRSLRDLALDFGYSLLPIAVVYHLSHYATLLLAHGLKLISLVSDPFGRKWDLFGTAHAFRAPVLLDYSVVWHGQVGLIVVGHLLSAVIAHRVALDRFPGRRRAALSQLPLLGLMIGYTVAGLWIIAQPLTAMLLR